MDDTLQKIEKLRAKFTGAGVNETDETFRQWEGDYKRAFLQSQLQENDAIKMIIEKYRKEISEMDYLLLNSDSTQLPDKERDRVIDRKKMREGFLALFTEADSTLQAIKKTVEENTKANANK
jgi:hypothetical protein